jgi:hypothetical protein
MGTTDMTPREILTFEYDSWKRLYDLTESIAKKHESILSCLFDDGDGISNVNSIADRLCIEMDSRIKFHYNLDFECDLFRYLVYEVPCMKDGGSITTEDGKEYRIRCFNDLLDYLETEYPTSDDER